MENPELQSSRKKAVLAAVLKNLFFYVLVPFLILLFLARPIAETVLHSDASAFPILLATMGAVVLNWLVYRCIHRKRPSLLVFAHGLFCLLIVMIIQYLALPGYLRLSSTLSILGVTLLQVILILLSFWFVSLKAKPAYAAAVTIRVIVGMFLAIMAGQIARDIENGLANGYTWLTLGILIALILCLFASRIRSAFLRGSSRRRRSGLATGRICKIVGETHLDLDDDLVTLFHAHVRYTVNGLPYETLAEITRFTLRRYGKETFIGGQVPVSYDPADPADAYVGRIRKPVPKDSSGKKESGNPPDQSAPENPVSE